VRRGQDLDQARKRAPRRVGHSFCPRMMSLVTKVVAVS
jgi:hypothetical protein